MIESHSPEISMQLNKLPGRLQYQSILADNSNKGIQTHRCLTTWSWYRLTYETKFVVICTLNLPVSWQLGVNKISCTLFEDNLKTHFQSPGRLATWSEQNLMYTVRRQLENTLSISWSAGNLERTKFNAHCSKTTWKHTFNLLVGWQLSLTTFYYNGVDQRNTTYVLTPV